MLGWNPDQCTVCCTYAQRRSSNDPRRRTGATREKIQPRGAKLQTNLHVPGILARRAREGNDGRESGSSKDKSGVAAGTAGVSKMKLRYVES
jgi:hypothetical protein